MGSHTLTVVLVVVFYIHLGTTEECGLTSPRSLEIGKSITITSPNYPNPIPGDCFIAWQFSSPENSIINLYCQEFDLPGITPACIDTFSFCPSPTKSSNDLWVDYCGKSNLELNTTQNQFEASFKSIPDNIVNPGLILYHSTRRFNCTITALETNLGTSGCGKNHLHKRIVGGEQAQLHEWPWMVALKNRSHGQICGGSLILPDWVLTAGHCVESEQKDDIYVRIGDHDINTEADTPYTLHVNVSQIIMHPGYIRYIDYLVNDIALLKLVNPVEYSYAISPVCLPTNLEAKSFANEKAITIGWGRTSTFGPKSDILLEVDLQVLSNEECTKIAGRDIITDQQVCANGEGKSPCINDSGGPLVWLDGNERYQLIGIVSFGVDMTACAGTDSTIVYTRVSSYIDWIEQETHPSLCSN